MRRRLIVAAVLFSAFSTTFVTACGGSDSNGAQDIELAPESALPEFVRIYADESDTRTPLASPLFGDYTGLPPLLIQVGQHEVIRDDSVRTAERARTAGVQVTLEVWAGMFHVFQSHEPLLPEAREAIAHIGDFMRTCLRTAAARA